MKSKKYIMIFAVIFWAGAFIAGKYTANVINPITITFLRFLIASVVLDVYLLIKKTTIDFNRQLIKESIILAVIGMIAYHYFFYTALKYTTAINSSLIAATNPFFTYMLSIVFLHTKPKLNKFAYIIIAFFSVSMIVVNWDLSSVFNGGVNPGDLFMALAVFFWASYSILVKKFIVNYNPLILTTVVFNITAILLIPFANYSQISMFFDYDLNIIISILYMGIFPTVFGYMIQQYSIKEIGPERTNIYINLVPVFAIILSIVILHESIDLLNIISGIIVVGAVYKFNTAK